MSCLAIRLKSRPNYEYCQSFLVLANEDGQGAGVSTLLCDGVTTNQRWVRPGEEVIVCAKLGETPTKINGTSSIEVTAIGPCTTAESSEQPEAVYFDLAEDFDLRETKRVTELSEVDTLTFDYSIGFDLPLTNHNWSLIKTQFNPNVLDNQYAELNVEVIAGSHVVSDAQLYLTNCKGETANAELRLSVNHWAKLSKDLRLVDLPYADIEYNCATIRDVVENQYPYTLSGDFDDQDNLGVWFPWVDYGRKVRDVTERGRLNNWILPDCYNRPWYYITGLLQRGFCKMGWGFTSPLFESEFGRKLITYIIDREYGLSGQVANQRRNDLSVSAESDGDTSLIMQFGNHYGSVWWPQIESDPLGAMDRQWGWYSACGEVNVKGKVIIQEQGGSSTKITLRLVRMHPQPSFGENEGGGIAYEEIESREFTDPGEENTWEFEVENISTTSAEWLGVLIERDGTGGLMILKDTSFIRFEGVRAYPGGGRTESLQNMIDSEYTFLDLLKGLAHNFNLKFKTDVANRTVEMYQAYTGDFWGDDIEGFYLDEDIQDIEALADLTSKDVELPSTEQPRYVVLSYADSNDGYIESLELANSPWSKRVDLGEKFTVKEEQELPNPFFEPTVNRVVFSVTSGTYIPTIKGEKEYTWNVGPRIAIANGYVKQENAIGQNPQIRWCQYNGDQTELIPTASMYCPIRLGDTHNDDTADFAYPLENLAFDVNPEIASLKPEVSLYDLTWKRWLIEQLNNIKIEYLFDLTSYDFWRLDFRKFSQIRHLGRPVLARIEEIRDYRHCKNIFTPIRLIPQRQLSNICDIVPIEDSDTPTEETICENNPSLGIASATHGEYIFTIGGQNNSIIDDTDFEYSTDDGDTWTVITPTTSISAELGPIFDDFLIRATVNYAETDGVICDSIVLGPTPISPCPEFEFVASCEQTVVYDEDGNLQNAVRLVINITTDISVSVASALYSLDGGGVQVPGMTIDGNQIISDNISGGEDVAFEIILQPSGCDQVVVSKSCTISQTEPDTTPEIERELLDRLSTFPERVQLFPPKFQLSYPITKFDQFWRVPPEYDGYKLQAIEGQVYEAGSGANSATLTVYINGSSENVTLASTDERARSVLSPAYTLATGDEIEFGLTSAGGTGTLPKGLIAVLIIKAAI